MKRHPYLVILAMLALLCVGLYLGAQTTAGIMPYIQMQFLDNSGKPLNGGFVYSYAAGTTTPLATYTDSGGGTANANPVVLDSAGRASIWLGASAYKFVIKTSAGATIRTIDGVTSPTISTASITIPSGQSLTLASGSTTSIATNLIPSGARTLGSSSYHWDAAFLDGLNLGGSIGFGSNNAYGVGSSASAASSIWAYNQYANKASICGTSGALSTSCYTINPTIDANNSYITIKYDAGVEIMRWSKKEGGSATLLASFPTMMIYAPLGLSVPGISAIPAGTPQIEITGSMTFLSGGSVVFSAGTNKLTYNAVLYANLGSASTAGAGTVSGFCTDCDTATTCVGGGAGHIAISDGTNWRCD